MPATQPSLLLALRNRSDSESWSKFVELYAPLVYGFLRKRGLQDADAANLTQDVLLSIAGAMHSFEYDPGRGSFRSWLFTVVHNRLCNFWRRADREIQGCGGTGAYELLVEQPAEDREGYAQWNESYERHLFQIAAEQVREDFQEANWEAFWQTAVEGRHAQSVATELGMSVPAVYMSKSRITKRIKKQIALLEKTVS